MNTLECQHLGKRYGRTWALDDCTLAVPEASVTALVGPNGAGKTTLLHLAVGLSSATTGTITVLGGLSPGSPKALAGVAFVAQDAPLYPGLSVRDTIRLAACLNDAFDESLVRARMSALDISLQHKVGKLSGGQHSQLAVALTLARRPKLLILDEPVARLDPLARHDVMSTIMAAVADDGLSVILSSHVVAELERVCDHLVLMTAGGVQVVGAVDDLLDEHRVLVGPTDEIAPIAATLPVVRTWQGEREMSLLIRGPGPTSLRPGWSVTRTSLEELVLSYLRAPDAHALPGPRASGLTRASA
ncbi:MAG: transporter ATP-binding protein [Ilumatobacteraceae bacterium]|nr:transporter ATP-binding protein [Ilumatobacteraceae bacterium]